MALSRNEIPPPSAPMEAVEVEGLGEVIVRGLMLRDRLRLMASGSEVFDKVPQMLAVCVVDASHQPLWDEAQWDAFGSRNFEGCLKLFDVAQRLSGMKAEVAEKN
jgi:hypothetical protein